MSRFDVSREIGGNYCKEVVEASTAQGAAAIVAGTEVVRIAGYDTMGGVFVARNGGSGAKHYFASSSRNQNVKVTYRREGK